jgi:hypothetical protein
MYQNYPFIVMSIQTLLHVSAYQRHHQGDHIILTSYLYVGVHYRKGVRGGAVFEALRYKTEGRGIDSRLCRLNFSLT